MDMAAPVGRLSETLMDLMTDEDLALLPPGYHYGFACRSMTALMAWFLPQEIARLQALGFYPVRLLVDRVVKESPTQMVTARRRPFTDGATRLSWPTVG
jgi:hypothetical protein